MKHALTALLLLLAAHLPAQTLYHQWYGDPDAPALAFLHGGPGYNSAGFEMDMAPRLAKAGYQVLVYDQRGSGRSEGMQGAFTYAEAVSDLQGLLDARGVQRVHLLGHSFGGTVALRFAHAHPGRVASLVLVSAPMDFPGCFEDIRANLHRVMEAKEDAAGLRSIDALAAMDSTSLEYSGTHFMYAMANGLYLPEGMAKEGEKLQKKLKKHPLAKWTRHSSYAPVKGFWEAEHYTDGNHMAMLAEVAAQTRVNAIVGHYDGLFTPGRVGELEQALGRDHVYELLNASHNVFLDDPMGFVDALMECVGNE